jgi:hypothetical protein
MTVFNAPEEFERLYVRPKAGRTLIVGSKVYPGKDDRRLRYNDVLGVDMLDGAGVDQVINLEDGLPEGKFSHVECRSVLEHSPRPWLLAANLELVLEQGGTIHFSAPFVWRIHGYPSDYFRYTAHGVRALFPNIRWEPLLYGNDCLREDMDAQGKKNRKKFPMMLRTEVLGFGVKL